MVTTRKQALEIAKKVCDGLEKIYGQRLRGVLLFGSAARDKLDEDSDIDIAIILDEIPDRFAKHERTGHTPGDGTMQFRFCPKTAKAYNFTILSNVPALNGKKGGITAYVPPPEVAQRPSSWLPNWWTDDPAREVAEGEHIGAKTVSRWREDFLHDFAKRMLRCQSPASAKTEK